MAKKRGPKYREGEIVNLRVQIFKISRRTNVPRYVIGDEFGAYIYEDSIIEHRLGRIKKVSHG